MEGVRSWLNQPLLPFLTVWMALAAGAALLLALVLVLLLVRRGKKRKQEGQESEPPITERPAPLPVLELANLQGYWQPGGTAGRLWHLSRGPLRGGRPAGRAVRRMGGMAEGGLIALETTSQLMGSFPWAEDSSVPGWIAQHSARVYQQFRGQGGTTLVAALLKENRLSFWCVGDSDLFLLREGRLYSLNIRQEFKNDLVLRALEGAFPVEEAFCDPQADALSEYIGKEEANATTPASRFFSSRRMRCCSARMGSATP